MGISTPFLIWGHPLIAKPSPGYLCMPLSVSEHSVGIALSLHSQVYRTACVFQAQQRRTYHSFDRQSRVPLSLISDDSAHHCSRRNEGGRSLPVPRTPVPVCQCTCLSPCHISDRLSSLSQESRARDIFASSYHKYTCALQCILL